MENSAVPEHDGVNGGDFCHFLELLAMLLHLVDHSFHGLVHLPHRQLASTFILLILAQFPCPHRPQPEVELVVTRVSIRVWALAALDTSLTR